MKETKMKENNTKIKQSERKQNERSGVSLLMLTSSRIG